MPSLPRANVSGLGTLTALVVAWEVAIASGAVDFELLPAPTDVAQAAVNELASGQLLSATGHTLAATLIAWLTATSVGLIVGVALGLWRPARLVFTTSVDVMRTLPVVAFVPVAVLLFGLSTTMEVVVAAWAALWPIVVNVQGAVQAVHARLHEVGAVFHLSRSRRLWAIVLPAAAPLMLVGARLGLSLALIVAVAAEMVGNPAGLGYDIILMQQALQPDAMFVYVLTCGALGVALNGALVALATRSGQGVFTAGERA